MVTSVPEDPDVGAIEAMCGITAKLKALLGAPPADVTTTGPLVAPAGIVAVIEPVDRFPTVVAPTPLKLTVPPGLKLKPVMDTKEPTGPAAGAIPVIYGVTVKFVGELAAFEATVTVTGPEVVYRGTSATMLVSFQLIGTARVPLKLTKLDPWVEPKLAPLMVTVVPTGPLEGESSEMAGATVKVTEFVG